ncbi:MAG: hypothetical protein M3Q58_08120 [Bacteroidota bacterium]|nr:hypothetical protein [Bacteroidota bacterium]
MKNFSLLKFILIACLSFLILWLNSCRTYPVLTPATNASKPDTPEQSATASVAGVRVIVQAQAWDGTTVLKDHITPLRVTINNNSGKSIKVNYMDFVLVSSDGEQFAALPPYEIEDSIQDLSPRANHDIITPDFFYEGFSIAPYYFPRYEGIDAFDGNFHYSPDYHDNYYHYWAEIPLPTIEMLQQALPEGVIQDKGKVTGFLYFEVVPDNIQQINFKMNVVDSENENRLGTLTIPFLAY